MWITNVIFRASADWDVYTMIIMLAKASDRKQKGVLISLPWWLSLATQLFFCLFFLALSICSWFNCIRWRESSVFLCFSVWGQLGVVFCVYFFIFWKKSTKLWGGCLYLRHLLGSFFLWVCLKLLSAFWLVKPKWKCVMEEQW